MKQHPSLETDNCSFCKEIVITLWNGNIHYRAHKSLPLVHIENHEEYCVLGHDTTQSDSSPTFRRRVRSPSRKACWAVTPCNLA